MTMVYEMEEGAERLRGRESERRPRDPHDLTRTMPAEGDHLVGRYGPFGSPRTQQSSELQGMAILGISRKVRSTLDHLHGSGSDVATKSHLSELGSDLLELAEAVERLSAELDRIADGRWQTGPPRS